MERMLIQIPRLDASKLRALSLGVDPITSHLKLARRDQDHIGRRLGLTLAATRSRGQNQKPDQEEFMVKKKLV